MGNIVETLEMFRAFAATTTPAGEAQWRLSSLENGLRIFEENPNTRSGRGGLFPDLSFSPGCKGVGLIFAHPDLVFKLVMDLGYLRSQWDLTYDLGHVFERVNEYTDIIHVAFRRQCHRHDFCLKRYWSLDADGTYHVTFISVDHPKCQVQRGLTRGKLFGGWIISPFTSHSSVSNVLNGSRGIETTSACLVTNIVSLERESWADWLRSTGRSNSSTQKVVRAQIAGLRELSEHTTEIQNVERHTVQSSQCKSSSAPYVCAQDDDVFFEACTGRRAAVQTRESRSTFELSDVVDVDAFLDSSGEIQLQDVSTAGRRKTKYSTGTLIKGKWPFEAGYTSANCWCAPDGDNFRVRGRNYLRDRKKILAGKPFAELVAVDWFTDFHRMDNICARLEGTCQRYLMANLQEPYDRFVFAVNIQVPGSRHFSIIYYFVLNEPLDKNSLFGRFVNGDDEFRSSRLKLIPNVALGPWVVQRAVGTKPLIVGRALKVIYHSSPNYLEVDIDIGSSAVANNVIFFLSLTFGLLDRYVRTLVVDMCFLIEAKSDEELPERLIGTSRVAHLEPEAAVAPPPI